MKKAKERTIKSILQGSQEYLAKQGVDTPRLDAEVLLADLLQTERIKLYVNYDYPLNERELTILRKRLRQRARGKPVSYLTGKKEFMSLQLEVQEEVLIPRPETEELVEKVLEISQEQQWSSPRIVDVGTGSGAILVSLLYYIPQALGVGIDISPEALKVARKNLKKHGLTDRAAVLEGDLLEPLLPEKRGEVDIVISNPPYIPAAELEELSAEVKEEPVLALAGGEDGLVFYRKLIPQANDILKPGGLLALEIGQDQGETIGQIFKDSGWHDSQLILDGAGRERIYLAWKGKKGDGDRSS